MEQEIKEIICELGKLAKARPPHSQVYQISATQPYVLDFKNRYYVQMFSPTAITLSIDFLGSINIPASTWMDISFTEGMKMYATSSTNPVVVLVRCTDYK